MDFFQNIINFFIASGILALLIRSIIKLYIDKDIEKFKSELQKETTRFKIQYGKLHLDRAEVIRECYQKIVKVSKQIDYLTSELKYEDRNKQKDEYIKANSEFNALTNYYQINAFYFEKDIQESFSELFQYMFQMLTLSGWLQYSRMTIKTKDSKTVEEEISEEEFDSTKQGLQHGMAKEMNLLKNKLESKLKNIIGVEE